MNTFRVHRHAAKLCGLTLVACLGVALAGCNSSVKTSPTVHNAKVTKAKMHASEYVTKGQTLTVRLPTEGGSMYLWRMSNSTARNEFLKFEQRQDQRNTSGQMAENGERAWDIFTFRAKHTGQASMTFNYEHQYSANEPIRTYALDVDVLTPETATATASAE